MKKTSMIRFACLAFLVSILGFGTHRALSQTNDTQMAEPGMVLAWDHSGLDVNGDAETLDHFRIDVHKSGVIGVYKTVNVSASNCEASDGSLSCEHRVFDILNGEPGGIYEFFVTAVDEVGNESERSGKIEVVWDGTRPRPIVNFRIEIRAVLSTEG